MQKCSEARVFPALIKHPLQHALDPAASWPGWGPQGTGSAGVLANFGDKHELQLRAAGCCHARGKTTPGMEKEEPICEIQQLK